MIKGKATLKHEPESFVYYDVIEKIPSRSDNGKGSITAKIALPKSWVGKRVICLLAEEPDEN